MWKRTPCHLYPEMPLGQFPKPINTEIRWPRLESLLNWLIGRHYASRRPWVVQADLITRDVKNRLGTEEKVRVMWCEGLTVLMLKVGKSAISLEKLNGRGKKINGLLEPLKVTQCWPVAHIAKVFWPKEQDEFPLCMPLSVWNFLQN